MNLPTRYLEICNSFGKRLNQINPGSTEVALPKMAALDALESLNGTSIAVLGGDVLRYFEQRLEYVYSNWYCNRLPGEVVLTYVERSRLEAASYVTTFRAVGNFEPLFVFVLSDR